MPTASESSTKPIHRRAGPLTLDIVRSHEEFLCLSQWWDALVDQCATRSPFMRWDWVSLWWSECRAPDAQLVIGVLRDVEGVPQAIAPLMFSSVMQPARKHLRHLTFLAGVGDAHGERLDFIVPAGFEDEMTPQLCRIFSLVKHECDTVRLNHLPEESANTPHIQRALKTHFSHASVLNRNPCSYIELPATWREYEERHSSAWRSKIRRHSNTFDTLHGGVFRMGGTDTTIPQALEDLKRLHAVHWPEGISSFLTPPSWSFHQRLAARWLPANRAIIPMLVSCDRAVAVLYGFIERGEFFQYQMGWDQAFAKISIGRLIIRHSIDLSIKQGLHVHDMLPGEHPYKRHWCESSRCLLDLEAHNPASWRAHAFHAMRAARRLFPYKSFTPDETIS